MNRHIDDVNRLVVAAAANGIALTQAQAYQAWSDYSDSYAAGWMMMPHQDGELWSEAQSRVRRIHVFENLLVGDTHKLEALERVINVMETHCTSLGSFQARYYSHEEMFELWTKVIEHPDSQELIHGDSWGVDHLSPSEIYNLVTNVQVEDGLPESIRVAYDIPRNNAGRTGIG